MKAPPSARAGLIEVAVGLFAARGYAGTSIRDIAQAAGSSVANVYHHFGNKEDLWLAILERSIRGLPELLEAATAAAIDPLDRFDRLVRAHLAEGARHQREARIFFIDEGRLSPSGNAINRRLQLQVFAIYQTELQALKDIGCAPIDDVRVAALNVLGVINWHLRWARPSASHGTRDRWFDEIVGFVTRGIGVTASPPGAPPSASAHRL